MIIPFEKYDYLTWNDIKRCPYPPFNNHPQAEKWNTEDDKRLLLIALDRYVYRITYWHKYVKKVKIPSHTSE